MEVDGSYIEEYFAEKLDDRVVQDEKLALLLLVLDERPGVLIMNPDLEDRKTLKMMCQDFDLEFLYTGGDKRRGLKDRLKSSDSRLFKGGFFIASESQRFSVLKDSEGRFYGFSDRAVGEFLGYPEDDITYFADNVVEGHIERPTRKKAEELVSRRVLKAKDLKYLELVSYVPRPEEENIVQAVETGREREEKILEMDENKGTDVGKEILSQVFRQPLYKN